MNSTLVQFIQHNVVYAWRSLRGSPKFTLVALATLAIGIGATTALFSTVNATLLRPLPYARASDLVDVRTRLVDGRVTTGLLSGIEIDALNNVHGVIEQVTSVSGQPFDATLMRDHGDPVAVTVNAVTEGFFDLTGLPMTVGRGFSHEEHVPGGRDAPASVVLSYRAWTTLFSSDPAIVGKTIRVAEIPILTTVVGIASPALDLPHGTDVWINARISAQDPAHGFAGILRLRSGATLEQLRSSAAVAMSALARTVPSDVGREYVVRSLVSSVVGDLGPILLIVLGATVLLLGLACVNVTNLLLARAVARMREMAVRTALGASRFAVIGQLLTESLMLSAAGAVVGLLFGWAALRLLLVMGASSLPRLNSVPFDGRVLLFGLLMLVFSGLATGVIPAWRLANADIRSLLNESGRSTTPTRGTLRLMSGLVVAEIALATAVVAGAGWLVQSFARLRATDPGFRADARLVIDIRPTRTFKTSAEAMVWLNEMLKRMRTVAGVAAVGSTQTLPLTPDRDGSLNVELQSEPPNPNRVNGGHLRNVSPGFFDAMGTKLLAGRDFTADDRLGTQRVVIVNRAFVGRFLGTRDPLTNSMAYGYPTVDRGTMSQIVGVVDDVRYKSLAEESEPTNHLPRAQMDFPFMRQAVVVLARRGNPEALIPGVRAELKRFDPDMLFAFTTVSQIVADTLARQKLGMTLLLTFAATASVLAAIGIYGVVAYGAAQRSGELATRIALGASGRDVFWLMLVAGQRLMWMGLLIGLASAYASGRVVASSVYGMHAGDPLVLVTAAMLVAIFAGLTILGPAITASRLSPARALRAE